jgi:hypothetical protein
MQAYVTSAAGASVLAQFKHLHRSRFPRAWKELQGLAEGSGIPFEDVSV